MYLKDKVAQISSDATNKYLEEGVEPAKTIAKYAEDENMSSLQIDRVVNKTNRSIIVELQKEAAKKDPHFTFPTAKTAEVIGMIDTGAKAKLPDRKKLAKLPLPTVGKEDSVTKIKQNLNKAAELKVEKMMASAKLGQACSELFKMASFSYMEVPGNVMDRVLSHFETSPNVNKAFRLAYNETGKHTKIASVSNFSIEKEHPLFKKAEEVKKLEDELDVISEVYDGYRKLCR